ncbi:hypothetical protein HDU81_001814 [Chytriomyces hyalinus]|nr:hypothetical protein HDU81_001814 [Chytriomyces hyalinus]
MKTTNITLGFIGYYCGLKGLHFNNHSLVSNTSSKYDPTQFPFYSAEGWLYFNDAIMQMAVDQVNADPNILAGVHVNVKRFSDCGNVYKPLGSSYKGAQGGFAASVMAGAVVGEYRDVVGVVAYQFSTTAKGSAAVLSNQQIPTCSSGSSSPRFSNKENYLYFWRTMRGMGIGGHMAQLLRVWNVQRVAVISQAHDDMGRLAGIEIADTLHASGIQVVVQMALLDTSDPTPYDYAATVLKNSNVRYFILSGQKSFNARAAYMLGKRGLTGDEYVWMGNNQPKPLGDPLKLYGPDFPTIIRGFILFIQMPPNTTKPLFKSVYKQFNEEQGIDMSVSDFDVYFTLQMSYDCVMMMLRGFDKAVKEEGVELLARRGMLDRMNFTYFQNLGYDGLSATPNRLNAFGDLSTGYQAVMYGQNGTQIELGETDGEVTKFTFYEGAVPVFHDGGTVPPNDGSIVIPDRVYALSSAPGVIILVASVFGIVLSLGSFYILIKYRRNEIIRASSVPESLLMTAGLLIGYATLLLFIETQTTLKCNLVVIGYALSFCFVFTGFLSKNWITISVFVSTAKSSHAEMWQRASRFRMLNLALILGQVGLLWVWAVQAGMVPVKLTVDGYSFQTCMPRSASSLFVGLYVYNAVLFAAVVPTVVMSSQVTHFRYNDATQLVSAAVTAALLLICIIAIEDAQDFYTDFKVAVCVWLLVTFLYVCTVLRRFVEFYWSLEEGKVVSRARLSIQAVMRGSGFLKRSRKMGVTATLRQVVAVVKLPYAYEMLTKSVRLVLVKTLRRSGGLLWTSWCFALPELHVLADRVWLTLGTIDACPSFRLSATTRLLVRHSILWIECTEDGEDAFRVCMEFSSSEKADQFLKELYEAKDRMAVRVSVTRRN